MRNKQTKKGIRHTENKQQNGRSHSLSLITLNGNGLNSSIKRQSCRMDKNT